MSLPPPGKDTVTILSEQLTSCSDTSLTGSLKAPFPLGPLDQLVAPFIPVAVVFVYRSSTSSCGVPLATKETIPVSKLRKAVSRLLDYYPHLTGRLRLDALDGAPYVASFDAGAGLVTATCPARLDSLRPPDMQLMMSDLPVGGNALLPPYDPGRVCDKPILAIQHTRFACGGVALGVRCLHKLCDAEGFFQVARDLAEVYRSLGDGAAGSLAVSPEITPYLAGWKAEDQSEDERKETLSYQPDLYHLEPSKGSDADVPAPAIPDTGAPTAAAAAVDPVRSSRPVTGRFMRFSGSELAAIKQYATKPGSWISTFDALTAHLYQRIHLARVELRTIDPRQPELSPPDFLTPVNVRARLGLQARYFPNALICTYTAFPPSVLQDSPLSAIAKAIHEATRVPGVTSRREMERSLRWIASQPDKSRIRQDFRYGNGSLMASQWNKMDIYAGMVFEDRPILVAPPFTSVSLVDGLGYYLPAETQGTEEDEGDIEVALALSDPLWEMLDCDPAFRRFRT